MGVPGFFSWMRKISPNYTVIFKAPQSGTYVDGLFIDVNAALYTVIREWPSDTEEMFLDSVIEYMKWTMIHFQPKSVMYMALDGVAPAAKMVTQRARRFEPNRDDSNDDGGDTSAASPKRKKSVSTNKSKKSQTQLQEVMPAWWNRCAFSPGTHLMDQVAEKLRVFATQLAVAVPIVSDSVKLTVLMSSTNVPGEGEQKIFDYLRRISVSHRNPLKVAIVGSDADILIMAIAAMKTKKLQILSVRDQLSRPKGTDDDPLSRRRGFMYIKMGEVRSAIVNSVRCDDRRNFNFAGIPTFAPALLSDNQIILDFVALSCLVGNDFLPHIPSMSAYSNGLNKILDAYRKVLYNRSTPLVKMDERRYCYLDKNSFGEILKELASTETDDAAALDMESVERDTITSPSLPDWPYRYNNDRFGDRVEEACHCYIAGIEWTVHYYTNSGCPDLNWKYSWHHAPTLSALLRHLDTKPIPMWHGHEQKYPTTQRQLMNIIPPEAAHLVPERWRWLLTDSNSPIRDVITASQNGKNDARYKIKDFQASYIIPSFDSAHMDDLLDDAVLSDEEARRNQTLMVEVFKEFQ